MNEFNFSSTFQHVLLLDHSDCECINIFKVEHYCIVNLATRIKVCFALAQSFFRFLEVHEPDLSPRTLHNVIISLNIILNLDCLVFFRRLVFSFCHLHNCTDVVFFLSKKIGAGSEE